MAAPEYAVNEHCTGTGLTSFFECALYPSSIASFDTVLNPGGSLTIIDAPPGYGGQWSMPDTGHLIVDFWDDVGPAGSVDGWGVSADCFEGPHDGGGTYSIPYRICLQ